MVGVAAKARGSVDGAVLVPQVKGTADKRVRRVGGVFLGSGLCRRGVTTSTCYTWEKFGFS
jgi:hypothetical protein